MSCRAASRTWVPKSQLLALSRCLWHFLSWSSLSFTSIRMWQEAWFGLKFSWRVWGLCVLTGLGSSALSLPLSTLDCCSECSPECQLLGSNCAKSSISIWLWVKVINSSLAPWEKSEGIIPIHSLLWGGADTSLNFSWGLELNFRFAVKPECGSAQCCLRDGNKNVCSMLFIMF